MRLLYLDFDFSDEESGRGSFDAMAAVLPDRLPALLAEIGAVLRWAHAAFGPAGVMLDDAGEWEYLLQGLAESGTPLHPAFDPATGHIAHADAGTALSTWTLTLSGTPAFCEALRERFGIDG